MLIKRILSLIQGYLKIVVEGFFVERFINNCTSKNILLWNSKLEKSTLLTANISIQDFKRIKKIAKATKCKVKILDKKGLPFIFERYKKRKIFACLLAVILIALIAMSNFIWNIEIKCEEEIDKESIVSILKENGLEIGKLKKQIDTVKIVQIIRFEREDIAWAGLHFEGTNAILEIVKAKEKPEIIMEDEYCNIVSDKEGIITKINAQNGTAAVKVGDLIKKGTILVNGYLEGKYTGIRYVHANAEIEAKVWYSKKERIEKVQEENVKTGNVENKYSIKINNFEINFYKTLSKFENYDTIEEYKKLKLFSDFYLPIEWKKKTNYETEKQICSYSADELKERHLPKIEEELEAQIKNKDQIVNKQINFEDKGTYVEIEVIYEVIENIGTKEKIVFWKGGNYGRKKS